MLVEPSARCWSNAELATKLSLQTRPDCSFYDVVIVGGGPAGLTAAVYASRDGLDTPGHRGRRLRWPGGSHRPTGQLSGLSGVHHCRRVRRPTDGTDAPLLRRAADRGGRVDRGGWSVPGDPIGKRRSGALLYGPGRPDPRTDGSTWQAKRISLALAPTSAPPATDRSTAAMTC